MYSNTSKIFFVFFGILSWLSTMFLFILPMLTPYQKYIENQNGISAGWVITLLAIITLFYIGILILDIFSTTATQVLQFVLLTVVVVSALPSITAFVIVSFIVDISIIEIFIPIILIILASMLHILWFAIPFLQNKQRREELLEKNKAIYDKYK
ncbi:hypothetical protein BUZ15_08975 [Staphylococcus gallinarum]|jgi:hypothetical protein|uniref:hypothetical protein n=1 Tax=Staphylococcus gallinarum TaxID=1293 RepID=UPI000D1E584A|nr:hypothetical protein [Staphylococcus gallinarum]MCD8821847.1 hypothetical protein [Staphylococcus gallinarum]PTL09077.1 hypothetical protein BUZ15_08975 [Staphylococcus gallinarum]PTL12416.1 hypothetical protein BUZ09_01155 [Staphylococcus gallinarum]RIL34647.1 hypothetical protein BUY98_03435 [Staphylococcus gallinarum]RIO77672.1 hypothetical protein BUZ12_03265 [Staphylococcus gallinarum]